MPDPLIVVGGGEHARVIMEAAALLPERWKLLGYIAPEDDEASNKRFSLTRLGDDSSLPAFLQKAPKCKLVCGVGDNALRSQIVSRIKAPDNRWAVIIHPSACVSPNSSIMGGTVVFSRSIIQTGVVIGAHCIINSGSIVEHDSALGDFVHIAPGAVTGGGVKIGNQSLIGLGARIRDHITIGGKVTLGTGAVAVTDILDGEIAVGIPARRISAAPLLKDIHEFCVSPEASIFEAMSIIGKQGTTAVVVTDPQLKVLGLLTDGDIRRAMLKNADLNKSAASVMNKKFRYVSQNLSRIAALDQMNALGVVHMPILDDHGRLVGVHLLSEMVGNMELPNVAVIMAGGKGVRLKPITNNIPKPMVKVAGRPILEHIILHLAGCKIRKIFLSINYLGEIIEEYFRDGSTYGVEINYLREENSLGTAGSLKLLPTTHRTHPVIVMNGDLITQFDVERMLHRHCQANYRLTIGAHDYRVDIPYGVIDWDNEKNNVIGIREKPEERFMVNGGVYIIDPALIEMIDQGRNFSMTDLIERCLEQQIRVGAHLLEGDWIDVGQRRELALARGL